MNIRPIANIIFLFAIGIFEIVMEPHTRVFDTVGGFFIGLALVFALMEASSEEDDE